MLPRVRPHLSPLEERALAAFVGSVRARFGERVAAVVLFGSRARGEGHAESDLDVLVLIQGLTRDDRRTVIDLAYDVELATRLVVAPIVRDAARFQADSALGVEIARDGFAL